MSALESMLMTVSWILISLRPCGCVSRPPSLRLSPYIPTRLLGSSLLSPGGFGHLSGSGRPILESVAYLRSQYDANEPVVSDNPSQTVPSLVTTSGWVSDEIVYWGITLLKACELAWTDPSIPALSPAKKLWMKKASKDHWEITARYGFSIRRQMALPIPTGWTPVHLSSATSRLAAKARYATHGVTRLQSSFSIPLILP